MIQAAIPEAVKLMHEGVLALSQVEANGARIDVDYLDRTIEEVTATIEELTANLQSSKVYKIWKKSFGSKFNLDSNQQLAHVLFKKMGFVSEEFTNRGDPSTDESNLKRINHPFIPDYLQLKKLKKLLSTSLKGVRREVVDGYLHTVFNLHLVKSYRSSSDSPNFQNIPIRNKEIASYIRRAFIPRDGNYILEIDYGQIEVRGSVCYHKDPTMLQYILDDHDFHLDFARKCFRMKAEEVSKPVRQVSKNGFVFPCFYGSFFGQIAPAIWETIEIEQLETAQGVGLYRHLKEKKIRTLEQFTEHIKNVESYLWDVSFPGYRDWKKSFFNRYQSRGWFKLKTGFVVHGYCTRKEVCNYPIQGSSFHCLLWSLIRLNKWLRKHKMRTKIIGQIHDSIILDVHPSELQDVLESAKRIMTEDIRRAWSWIITPLVVEAEMSETNWFEKKGIKI